MDRIWGGGAKLSDSSNGGGNTVQYQYFGPGEYTATYTLNGSTYSHRLGVGDWKGQSIPGWFGAESKGGGIAFLDVDGNGLRDLAVVHVDNTQPTNTAYLRIGRNMGSNGSFPSDWTNIIRLPGMVGGSTQGVGLASAQINSNPAPDLVFFFIHNKTGENVAHYRILYDITSDGSVSKWSDLRSVPGWFGAENQGGGVAVGDVDGNGRPDLIFHSVDNPPGENRGYYRVGFNFFDLVTNNDIEPRWSEVMAIPGWFGAESQGASAAFGDLNRNGSLDLIVFSLDNPPGENNGYYRVGYDIGTDGKIAATNWGAPIRLPLWFGGEDQGGSVAIVDTNGNGPGFGVFHIDNPPAENTGYFRFVTQ